MELDGTPAAAEDIRSLALINYGHFTSMRVEDHRVRGLGMHLQRLVDDCHAVFDADLDPDRVRHLIGRVIREVSGPIVVRVTVFDPQLTLGRPGGHAEPRVLITTRPAVADGQLPPLRLQSRCYRRDLPSVKHVGLFGPLLHRRTAQRNGYDDVLFVDARSRISEGATWNVGFVDGDQVVWPDAEVLPGVTMRLLQQNDSPPAIRAMRLSDLAQMTGAFATNAATGVRPVGSIDSTGWPPGHPVIERLSRLYADVPPEPV
jgi:branched-subunit amino acid aminotransferase/4-amino-4-deoxychorismate lyase